MTPDDLTSRDLKMIAMIMAMEMANKPDAKQQTTAALIKNAVAAAAADSRWHVVRRLVEIALERSDPARPKVSELDYTDLLVRVAPVFADMWPLEPTQRNSFIREFCKLTGRRLETARRYLQKRNKGLTPDRARLEVESWSRFSP